MNTLGRGTLLAERYRLEERVSDSDTSSLWRGVDTTLDRQVAIRIISPKTAGDALDAARRAALIDDPRLVRLLDVAYAPSPAGGKATQTYVVSEWIDGKSLADLVNESGPLPADRVRMMVGEAADALASAAGRGLHHLALDPTSVLLTSDGAVRVHGLAVTAAARGGAQPDGAAAERVDAVGLVSLIYAGLTGRWPLPTDSHDQPLETAPMVGNTPSSPSELVSGVPNDLDTLCSVTFGHAQDGPTSPADLVAQLKPWGTTSSMSSNRLLADDLRHAPKRPPSRFPIQLTPAFGQDAIPAAPRRSTATSDLFGPSGAAAAGAGSGDSAAAARPAARQAEPADADDDWGLPLVPDTRDDDGADGPYDDDAAAAEPDRPRRKLAWIPMVLVGALVLAGLGLAVSSLSRNGNQTGPAASTSSAPATSAAPAGVPPKIVEVTAFDPEGDDGENDDEAKNAMDGDPATTWGSSRYKTAAFGNLKKGVGLVIKLEQPSTVKKVTVTAEGEGGAIEIRTATGATLDGSQVVASGPAGGTLEKTLEPSAQTEYLIVWFTELPRVDGQYRAVVAEVGVA